MRKRKINISDQSADLEAGWLNLERLAQVEITSEDSAFPIEGALAVDTGAANPGWRAAQPGEQLIRLQFDEPQQIRRILLRCEEHDRERTQEFVLRWSPDGRTYTELLRQQWNFSPKTANTEVEDFKVDLKGVSILEQKITPDIRGGDARASVAAIRLA
jgi:hypothetical protein